MARNVKDAKLDTRNARSKLPPRREPYWRQVSRGLTLGYRRTESGAGTWIAKHYAPERGRKIQALGVADDILDANGHDVLSFDQAQDKMRRWLERLTTIPDGSGACAVEPITVDQALDRYNADLQSRGGDLGNVSRLRHHLSQALRTRPMVELRATDLRTWRNQLIGKLAPATVNRTTNAFKAALNLAADHDESIADRRAWQTGLSSLPDAEEARNVILSNEEVCRIVATAHEQGGEFGLLVEVAAVTGARYSQMARLEIQDLLDDPAVPRLMMPSSKKGKGQKKILRRPVPIPPGLALKLKAAAEGRRNSAPLLLKPSGASWRPSDHSRLFRRAVKAAGVAEKDGEPVTLYALRHSSITRQLLAGVPVRIVAAQHDTSVMMIERNYSSLISDHADALARSALLDVMA